MKDSSQLANLLQQTALFSADQVETLLSELASGADFTETVVEQTGVREDLFLEKLAEARQTNDFSLVKHYSRESAFHGGGHFLHSMFWKVMHPEGGGQPSDSGLRTAIRTSFGSYDGFRRHFKAAAGAVEGSGWGVMALEPNSGHLVIHQIEKQSDLSMWVTQPLLMVDVWEHAYYVDYRNARPNYLKAFWELVNWVYVSEQFAK